MKIYSPLVLLLLAAFAGCSAGTRTGSAENTTQAPQDFHMETGAVRDGKDFRFYLATGTSSASQSMRIVQSISQFKAILRRADGSALDSLSTDDIVSSGQKNTETKVVSLARTATLEWNPPKNLPPGTSADLMVFDDKGTTLGVQHILLDTLGASPTPSQTRRSIELELQVRSMGGGVEFLVTATRRFPASEGEYLPSGEQYRIELATQLGEPIWSNDNGIVYTQDIRQVEPAVVGESVLYRGFWDGTDPRTRKFAPPGRYKVLVTIPARPTPYTLHEEIQLGGD